MNTTIKNILFGSLAALMCAGILIYAIEDNRSFYQIAAGFFIFVLPFAFLPTFFSKTGSFIFVFITIMIGYFLSKFYYNDFWIGVLLAAIIGGSFFIFLTIPSVNKMNDYKPFSPKEYKEKAKQFHNNK
jgi:hypothetical protein